MKSAKQYIIDGDFDGAYERFQNANGRWLGYWFDVCFDIANSCKEFLRKYIFDHVAKTICEKVTTKRKYTNWDDKIIVECDLLDNAKEKCYLFEFYDSENNLVCSKVGTTTRKVIQRLKEELRSKTYTRLDCQKAIVKKVYDCGTTSAEGMESFFRAFYIANHKETFKKNDRFMGQLFDYEKADEIAEQYLEMVV